MGLLRASVLITALLAAAQVQAADPEGSDVTPGLGQRVYEIGRLEVFGDGPDVLTLGAGAFDFAKTKPASAEARIEYRVGRKVYFLGPSLGFFVNSDGGFYGYGAIYLDIQIERLVITPAAGLGGYHRGDSKGLGGDFLFHLALDFAHRFDDGQRLGVKVTHNSNAFIFKKNPGAESILLTYSVPVGNLF